MDQVKLIPREGVRVTYPRSRRVLPSEGAVVPFDTYWRHRLRDGDVTRETETQATDPTPRTTSRSRRKSAKTEEE